MKKTQHQPKVLTPRELQALDKGQRTTIQVPAHKRRILVRPQQSRKDRAIEGFAVQWLGQLERYGITEADRRHARGLVDLLVEVGVLQGY